MRPVPGDFFGAFGEAFNAYRKDAQIQVAAAVFIGGAAATGAGARRKPAGAEGLMLRRLAAPPRRAQR